MCGSRIGHMSHTHANHGAGTRRGLWGGQGVHFPLGGWEAVSSVGGAGEHTECVSLHIVSVLEAGSRDEGVSEAGSSEGRGAGAVPRFPPRRVEGCLPWSFL